MKTKFYYSEGTGEYAGTALPVGDGFNFTYLAPPNNKNESESFLFDGDAWITVRGGRESHAEKQAQEIRELESQLDQVEKRIMRLERIKQRTDSEEIELDELIDESTELFRRIELLKTALETEDEEKEE